MCFKLEKKAKAIERDNVVVTSRPKVHMQPRSQILPNLKRRKHQQTITIHIPDLTEEITAK